MRFSNTFLLTTLAISASAVDTALHFNDGCRTGKDIVYGICRATEVNECCSHDLWEYQSLQFRDIPHDWNIEGDMYTRLTCNGGFDRDHSLGRREFCLPWDGKNPVKSGAWAFVPGDWVPPPQPPSFPWLPWGKKEQRRGDKKCRRPDVLALGDESELDVSGLDEAAYNELVCSSICASITWPAGANLGLLKQ